MKTFEEKKIRLRPPFPEETDTADETYRSALDEPEEDGSGGSI